MTRRQCCICEVVNCLGGTPTCLAVTFTGIVPANPGVQSCNCMNRTFYLPCNATVWMGPGWYQRMPYLNHGDLNGTACELLARIAKYGPTYYLELWLFPGMAEGFTYVLWSVSLGSTKPTCLDFSALELAFSEATVDPEQSWYSFQCDYSASTATITAADGDPCPADDCHSIYCDDCEEVESYTVRIAGVVPYDPPVGSCDCANYNQTFVLERDATLCRAEEGLTQAGGNVYTLALDTGCWAESISLTVSVGIAGRTTFKIELVGTSSGVSVMAEVDKCLVDDETPIPFVDGTGLECDFALATAYVSVT